MKLELKDGPDKEFDFCKARRGKIYADEISKMNDMEGQILDSIYDEHTGRIYNFGQIDYKDGFDYKHGFLKMSMLDLDVD